MYGIDEMDEVAFPQNRQLSMKKKQSIKIVEVENDDDASNETL